MSSLRRTLKRSGLPVLLVLCLAALSVSYAYADEVARPRALQIIGDPDAAVNGRFAVGTASVGSKALTVVGVIDFLGAGTVHNYFTQGTGNNMQINTNVDESNVIGDASRSQWKLVLGSSLDWFSIRRSPAGGTYNEDALFFIEGSTGRVGIATVDTNNAAAIPFTPQARLHVQTTSGSAIYGRATATTGYISGIYGQMDSTQGNGVAGYAAATSGTTNGVLGSNASISGRGVYGYATATTGSTSGVFGQSDSTSGRGVYGYASAATGSNTGTYGETASTSGRGVYGYASATTGTGHGVHGESASTSGYGLYGYATATSGPNYGVYAQTNSGQGYAVYGINYGFSGPAIGVFGQSYSTQGTGVYGYASATTGSGVGVRGGTNAPDGRGVSGYADATTGTAYGVYGGSESISGSGVLGDATATTGATRGVYGLSASTSGYGVFGWAYATSGANYGVYGQSDSPSGYGVYSDGDLYADGDITASGTKSAIVETQDYSWRTLYTIESPQNWFEDFGQATLVAGEAVVPIEPIFAQTVNLDQPYHVFLTPQDGFCSLYVTAKSASSFTVRALEGASCEITFDYRIIAPRLDYEDLRLEPAEDPEAVAASLPMLE